MKLKFEDYYGTPQLVSEEGLKFKVEGQTVSYKAKKGRIWAISDKSSHCGGHGMGSMTSVQAILILEDQSFIKVDSGWNAPYTIIWDI